LFLFLRWIEAELVVEQLLVIDLLSVPKKGRFHPTPEGCGFPACRDKNAAVLIVFFSSVDLPWIGMATLLHISPVLAAYRTGYLPVLGGKFKLVMATPYLVVPLVRLHFPERVNVPDRVFCQPKSLRGRDNIFHNIPSHMLK
jgi:hypothetical protein